MDKFKGILEKGISEIIGQNELVKKVESGRSLTIKLGADPTKPDLHLGHAVVLRKLKEFQDLGHKIVFVIGDYTTRIGDPSERSITRPMLSEKEIEKNTKTYSEQVSKILDIHKVQISRNSEWIGKLSLAEFIKLTSQMTVANLLERDDFSKRLKENQEIGLHELLYPVMQAYDSVYLEADLEVGGTDQKFNMLAGRELMKKMGLKPQAVLTMPLLVGLDGKRKMSKSLDNYIAFNDKPADMFGKVMSIPDELIVQYYELCTNITEKGLKLIKDEVTGKKNPRDIKARLAKLIVEDFYDASSAEDAEAEFSRVFKEKKAPSDVPEIEIQFQGEYPLAELLMRTDLVKSKSEARRLIEQGAVKIDGALKNKIEEKIGVENGMVIQVGKRRFVKIKQK